jgi:hypothetical protein
MHETLRADARRHRGVQDDPQITNSLAEHYDAATDARDAEGSSDALLTLMEASYYAATAARRDIIERRGCFVEQLDLLGKMLSLEQRDYLAAVEVFERSLQLDPENDYAAHYVGFNLDRLGIDPVRAEASYRRAVALNDKHAWWRSRLISFLAERGHLTQARREWDDALDDVLAPDGTSDVFLYETLHGWVAATLLRIGELGFAHAVLSDVPEIVLEESPMLRELLSRLRAFEIADAEGAYVPATHLREGWWRSPILLQRRIGTDDRLLLRRWLAGRIEALDDEFVELRVADLRVDESPRYGRTRVTVTDFDSWTRDAAAVDLAPGRFVEIGLYSADDGSDATRLLRVHPIEPVGEDAPSAVGPLDRWHQELARLDNEVYRQVTGIGDSRLAGRHLAQLVELDLLEMRGTRRWASYTLGAGTIAEQAHEPVNEPVSEPVKPTESTEAERRAWIFAEIDAGRSVRRPTVRAALGLTDITARRILDKMVADGLIVFEGAPKTGTYRRTDGPDYVQ